MSPTPTNALTEMGMSPNAAASMTNAMTRERTIRQVRVWQVGRAVKHQHGAAGFQCIDGVARTLYEQDVTSSQADGVQVACDLRTRCPAPCEWRVAANRSWR